MTLPEIEIVGLGEILWDLLPSGPLLGGAPFNFTYQCHQLGHPCAIVSRVGAEEFDPEIHEAAEPEAGEVTGTTPENVIVKVRRRGWKLHDQVLQYPLVVVN